MSVPMSTWKGTAPVRQGKIARDFHKNWFPYLAFVPVLIWFIVFCYGPMWGVLIAFKDFKPLLGFAKSEWVGLQHFRDFISGPDFGRQFRNTVLLSLWGLAIGFPIPILLAIMINELRGRFFKKSVQTITYMPHFISIVVICGIIHIFTQPYGLLTNLISFFTGATANRSLLGEAGLFRPVYTLSGVWQNMGWDSIIYLAAMSNISPELYESADLDGAGRVGKIWHITLPGIRPTILILLIFAVGGMMNSNWEKIILLYNPLTYETADVFSTYVYRRGIREGSFSFSTAVGLFNSVINFLLLLFTNAISRRFSETSLW